MSLTVTWDSSSMIETITMIGYTDTVFLSAPAEQQSSVIRIQIQPNWFPRFSDVVKEKFTLDERGLRGVLKDKKH